MSRIKVLLQDCEADKRLGFLQRRVLLDKDQWDDILAADARGVSARTMFAKLSGVISPFFKDPKTFANALASERKARRDALAAKK